MKAETIVEDDIATWRLIRESDEFDGPAFRDDLPQAGACNGFISGGGDIFRKQERALGSISGGGDNFSK